MGPGAGLFTFPSFFLASKALVQGSRSLGLKSVSNSFRWGPGRDSLSEKSQTFFLDRCQVVFLNPPEKTRDLDGQLIFGRDYQFMSSGLVLSKEEALFVSFFRGR